ncbi:MAG: hypothetical protein WCS27_14655 [Victivallaceae bacterium]
MKKNKLFGHIIIAVLCLLELSIMADSARPHKRSWILNEKVRCINIANYSQGSMSQYIINKVIESGFNSVCITSKTLNNWEKPFKEAGIHVFIKNAYMGLNYFCEEDRKRYKLPYQRVVDKTGKTAVRTPCPLDKYYWDLVIEKPLLELIAKNKNYSGCHLDFELYLNDLPTVHEYGLDNGENCCYCDKCFNGFLRLKNYKLQKTIPANMRFKWLKSRNLTTEYQNYLESEIIKISSSTRKKVHEINPDFVFLFCPWFENSWYLTGLAKGFGTSKIPSLVVTEQTYFSGYNMRAGIHRQKLKNSGVPALFLGGLSLEPVALKPERFGIEMYNLCNRLDGYYIWSFYHLVSKRKKYDHYCLPKGYTADDYLKIFKRANEEIKKNPDAGNKKNSLQENIFPKNIVIPEINIKNRYFNVHNSKDKTGFPTINIETGSYKIVFNICGGIISYWRIGPKERILVENTVDNIFSNAYISGNHVLMDSFYIPLQERWSGEEILPFTLLRKPYIRAGKLILELGKDIKIKSMQGLFLKKTLAFACNTPEITVNVEFLNKSKNNIDVAYCAHNNFNGKSSQGKSPSIKLNLVKTSDNRNKHQLFKYHNAVECPETSSFEGKYIAGIFQRGPVLEYFPFEKDSIQIDPDWNSIQYIFSWKAATESFELFYKKFSLPPLAKKQIRFSVTYLPD